MDFNYNQYKKLREVLSKRAQFVPMDPSMAGGDPAAAGGGMPPPEGDPAAAGGMPPMDPSMMGGGDPAAMGMPPPGDPAAGGGMPPMDPSMMGGDPASMGMPPPEGGGDVSPTGEPYMKITPTQLSKLFKQFAEVFKSVLGIQSQPGQVAPAAAPAPAASGSQDAQLAELNAKLDAIIHG